MKNRYQELSEKHQKEFNKLPLGFAYSDKQFREVMTRWGLDPKKDLDKLVRIPGGGFIQKKDLQLLKDVTRKNNQEMQAAIDDDPDGTGFIYEMFYCELSNHEFDYTRELDDTLYALGYTLDDIKTNLKLKSGLEKAIKRIINKADEIENEMLLR